MEPSECLLADLGQLLSGNEDSFGIRMLQYVLDLVGETSGSIGTAILPLEVMAKNATPQLGIFSERIAILSEALMPKVARTPEIRSQASLKPAYV